ncbi:hypothetical protein OPS25_13280 [Alteromonas ponticola]|uniref:Exonuclease domain-containing protein n=1 Tax=Alteromonas aquimaris TaxID=2998417 RepID=A0ABT3P9M0_9ALTE|nr:hypothetical protein [Alteromonas aquimaris]MCW8109476.1 hypothetical protein [Alteromonas aquimaris]
MVPTILDIEASGFGAHSYPIEIGVVTGEGERYCSLIKPFSEWQHWDEEAEQIHGIPRSELIHNGQQGREVCLTLNRLLMGQTVYSDGWAVDYSWLRKLYAASGLAMGFSLSPIEMILNEKQLEGWSIIKQGVLAKMKTPRHRASADAQMIQTTYALTVRAVL